MEFWKEKFFPHSRISQVPIEQIRDTLLQIFGKWGLPKVIKTDNGAPFGAPSRDVVPIMSLWLKGWKIHPVLNRPKVPQDNPKVERAQGTSSRWAEIHKARDAQDLQNRLDLIIQEHLDKYPVKRFGNVTRTQLFPALYNNPRKIDITQFDFNEAYEFLAHRTLQRKVALSGSVVLYGKVFQVHASFKRQFVNIKFNTPHTAWDVIDQQGKLIKSIEDQRFNPENIISLTACQRT